MNQQIEIEAFRRRLSELLSRPPSREWNLIKTLLKEYNELFPQPAACPCEDRIGTYQDPGDVEQCSQCGLLIPEDPDAYLDNLIREGSKDWEGVDPDEFMDEVRGRD